MSQADILSAHSCSCLHCARPQEKKDRCMITLPNSELPFVCCPVHHSWFDLIIHLQPLIVIFIDTTWSLN